MAFSIFKIVQNINKRVYCFISKLFVVDNGVFHGYKAMNIETKGIV